MRKWTLRLGIGLALLILVLVVALQIIFWTNVPRDLVIGAVQKALGLRVTAATLSTGFFGHTTLRDVTLALPLSDESFFKVERLDIDHTSVPGLILKRAVQVESVGMTRPNVVVRQDAAGNWNLRDVATLIARAGGSGNPQQQAQAGPANTLQLPAITIDDGSVLIVANNGQQVQLAPLNVRGRHEGTLTWTYDLSIGKQLSAVGRVAPGGTFKHEVDLKLRDVDEWVALVAPGFEHDIRADGTWRGQIAGGGVSGQLTIADAAFDQISAKGAINLSTSKGVEVRPEGLVVRTGQRALPEVTLLGGVVRTEADAVVADKLNLACSGGSASVSARFEPATRKLTAGAIWQDVGIVGAAIQSGSLTLAVSEPLAGRPQVEAHVENAGGAGEARWTAALSVRGDGRSYGDVDWTVTADRLRFHAGRRDVDLGGSVARLTTAGQVVTLHSLERQGARALSASGQFDAESRRWNVWLSGEGPRLAGGDPDPVTYMLNAWSDGSYVSLDELYLRDTELELTAKGYYIADQPDPVFLNVSLSQMAKHPALTGESNERPLVGGRVHGDFYIHGKASPPDLYMQGWLTGRDVVIGDKPLGDLKLTLDGSIDRDRQLTVKTQELSLFGGRWRVDAVSPTPYESTRVNVKVRDLPLHSLGELVGRDDVGGTLDGAWVIDALSFSPNDVLVRGGFEATDAKAGPLVAESVTATNHLRRGRLVNELTMRHGEGTAKFLATTSLLAPSRIGLTVDVDNWPSTTTSRSRALTSIDSNLQIDLKAKGATGTTTVTSAAFLDDQPAGDASLSLYVDGRVVQLTRLDARLLGGSLTGGGRVDLDRPLSSRAHVEWTGIDAAALGKLVPRLSDLGGTYSGFASVRPDTGPRPLGAMTAVLHVAPRDGRYRTVDVGGFDARLAIDVDPAPRVTLDRAKLDVAGGVVDVWGRATRHVSDDPILVRQGRDRLVAGQTTIRLYDLDLNTLVQAAKPGHGALDAKVSGELNLIADSSGLQSLVGDGRASLTDARLVNFAPVALLFDIMNVGADEEARRGAGSLSMRFEQGRVDINDIHYFEAGIEMLGVATVYDLYERKASPVRGQLAGTARPFRDTKIPFLADADEIFNVLQSTLTTVEIGGTLGDLKVRQALASEIGQGLKQLITGDVKSQVGEQ